MQFLQRPAFLNEPMREPVKQFRMARLLAHPSKIAGSANQPFSKVVLPNAVYDNASRQRIVGVRNPLGQRQSAQAASLRSREDGLSVHQDGWHPWRDFRS